MNPLSRKAAESRQQRRAMRLLLEFEAADCRIPVRLGTYDGLMLWLAERRVLRPPDRWGVILWRDLLWPVRPLLPRRLPLVGIRGYGYMSRRERCMFAVSRYGPALYLEARNRYLWLGGRSWPFLRDKPRYGSLRDG